MSLDLFASLASPDRETNEGRRAAREALREEIGAIAAAHPTAELLAILGPAGLVCAPVNSIAEVRDLPGIREHLTRTTLPDGREVRLPPTAVATPVQEYALSPRYGEHTKRLLEEVGLGRGEIDEMIERGVAR